jgi:hypothetical protein
MHASGGGGDYNNDNRRRFGSLSRAASRRRRRRRRRMTPTRQSAAGPLRLGTNLVRPLAQLDISAADPPPPIGAGQMNARPERTPEQIIKIPQWRSSAAGGQSSSHLRGAGRPAGSSGPTRAAVPRRVAGSERKLQYNTRISGRRFSSGKLLLLSLLLLLLLLLALL